MTTSKQGMRAVAFMLSAYLNRQATLFSCGTLSTMCSEYARGAQGALQEATPTALAELVAELAPWSVAEPILIEVTSAMRAARMTAPLFFKKRVPPEAAMGKVLLAAPCIHWASEETHPHDVTCTAIEAYMHAQSGNVHLHPVAKALWLKLANALAASPAYLHDVRHVPPCWFCPAMLQISASSYSASGGVQNCEAEQRLSWNDHLLVIGTMLKLTSRDFTDLEHRMGCLKTEPS